MYSETGLFFRVQADFLRVSYEDSLYVSKKFQPKKYLAKHTLFYQNHMPYGIYIIHEGDIEIARSEDKNKIYSQKLSIKNESPIILGMCSVMSKRPHVFSCECAEQTKITFLEKNDFYSNFYGCFESDVLRGTVSM